MNPRDRVQSPEPAPGDDVGGYVLKALLGRGGFGTVYLAERGGQRYALKLLPLAGLGDWGERELLMLARVKHLNVVRLLGYWQWPDQGPRFLVIIMEYVEGRRLDVWADTENPSAHAVLLRMRGVARALRALHEGKALHRDVKEANILVRETDGEAVLVDLGVGSHEDLSRITGGSLPPGTRAYLSPEAWRFHREHQGQSSAHYHSTPADDIYALGVVLYWLLTGRRPFHLEPQGDEAVVVDRVPVAPHVRNSRVPEELGALCLRLLETRPELRPDADALLAKLEELLSRDTAEWHVPLCDFHDAYNVTTRPGPDADEEAGWFNEAREDLPPRRGRRPARLAAELEPVVGSAAPAVPPPPSWEASTAPQWATLPAPVTAAQSQVEAVALAPRASSLGHTSWAVGVLGLLAVLCITVASHGGLRPLALSDEGGAPGPVQKVAPPMGQPESNGAAAPPEVALTAAVIALPTMSPKEPAPVMKPTPAGTCPPPPPPPRGTRSLRHDDQGGGDSLRAAWMLGPPGARKAAPGAVSAWRHRNHEGARHQRRGYRRLDVRRTKREPDPHRT